MAACQHDIKLKGLFKKGEYSASEAKIVHRRVQPTLTSSSLSMGGGFSEYTPPRNQKC